MTAAVSETNGDTREHIMRQARRAWFRAGVRRGDRHRLARDLAAELAAAEAETATCDVLGEDPAVTAADWARARGMADRRLRLGVILLPSLVSGVVAAGGLLAALADAFRGDGRSVLDLVGGNVAGILTTYVLAGLLAYAAILAVTGLLLSAVGDRHALRTVRTLARVLPPGAVGAALAGVGVAAHDQYSTRTETFVGVEAVVVLIVLASIAFARWLAVDRAPRSLDH